MKGRVKTYLSNKGYGFIKGDDGKDYFFHVDEFKTSKEVENICEETYVDFEQAVTPKGYKAVQCKLLNEIEVNTYVTPNNFMTSKTKTVKGWELLETGNWMVFGSSKDSPDQAKQFAINRAKKVGANVIFDLEYYKTTGEEDNRSIFDSPNYKGGVYRYTIHNFSARTGIVGKKNALGTQFKDDLIGTNHKAKILKDEMEQLNDKNRSIRLKGTLISLISFGVAYSTGFYEILIIGLLGLLTWTLPVDHGDWLREI